MSYFLPQELERIGNEVVQLFLIPRFRELDMNATGEWLQSLEVQTAGDSVTIRGRHYSEQLAKGREPGKMPPVNAIERWVNAKIGFSGSDGRAMAWAIAKKIQKEGTTWYQKGGSDLIEVLEEPQTVEYVQNQLAGILQIRIADNLVRTAQNVIS